MAGGDRRPVGSATLSPQRNGGRQRRGAFAQSHNRARSDRPDYEREAGLWTVAAGVLWRVGRPAKKTGDYQSPGRMIMTALLLALLLAANVQDADSRALLQLEDDWASALVKRDRVVFERLLADGFVYTENDQLMDRATVLNSVVAGLDTVLVAHNEEMQVHRYGPVTAVVTGWLVVGGRGSSGEFTRRYRFT